MDKIAIISDVHGNLIALKEVLKDIKIVDSDYDTAQCYIVGEYLFTKNDIDLAFEALKNIRDVKEIRSFNYIFLIVEFR